MQPEMLQAMRSQVRAIHLALTGSDLPEPPTRTDDAPPRAEDLARRFHELEAIVRRDPAIAQRVPLVWFTPPLDVIAGDDAVLLELAVPGVDRDDVVVAVFGDELVITGLRRDPSTLTGRMFHAEQPRGPFRRAIPLPVPLTAAPRWELERGVLRVFLPPPSDSPGSSTREQNKEKTGNDDHGSR